MRILVANPNTSADMTDRLVKVGSAAASPGTELRGVTAERGVPFISSRPEALLAGAELLTMIATHEYDADAVIVAAFGDPGVTAARDLFQLPVIGMSEAAIHTACMLGDRFAIVTFSPSFERWYEDCVSMTGLGGRSAGIYTPDVPFSSVANVQDEMSGALIDTANDAIEKTKADVIILAGAPLAGLAPKVSDRIGRPVVDPISAAVCQAEGIVRLGGRALAGPKLPPKSSIDLPATLRAAIAGE
ncbi:MAG: aspartate/glutamate racemase family protein [Pseudomonadota bacterium]